MEYMDSDEETELEDLRKLIAVLESDKPSASETASQFSVATISTCSSTANEYSKIEATLALNKLTDEKLKRFESILIDRLRECRLKLTHMQNQTMLPEKEEIFRYITCGKPYFKDKSNFSAPDNVETVLMTSSEMFDFTNMCGVTGWTMKDKGDLVSCIHQISKNMKSAELLSEMAQLRREIKNQKELKKKITEIKNQIKCVNFSDLIDVVLPIDQEYDWDLIANKLNYRHSAQEYQAMWKLFLHPSINKSAWSEKEHAILQDIAQTHKLQDWNKIAEELDTGRTGYQCFVYFRTNISNTVCGQKWTPDEEVYLKRLIEYYKEDNYIPWFKIAAEMENRTKIQIYNKYFALVEQRKGRFLPEEDEVILTCVEKFGPNFYKVPKYLVGRSVRQIRTRYNILTKANLSIQWSVQEDRKLLKLLSDYDSKTNFSDLVKYFPGKDRVHLRTRYLTLVKWMLLNPVADVSEAPRRSSRYLKHGDASENLNIALQNLERRIQTEVDSRKTIVVSVDSPQQDIEADIIRTLVEEMIKEDDIKRTELLAGDKEIVSKNESLEFIQSINVTNLQKNLILMRAKLNKTRFMSSTYYQQFRELTETTEKAAISVKTYSRKSAVKILNLKQIPDIWGKVSLGRIEYLLPPNYSTIMGCKKLIAYKNISSLQGGVELPGNVRILSRRNMFLKDQMTRLIERFVLLFSWPYRLNAKKQIVCSPMQTYQSVESKPSREKARGFSHGVVIPSVKDTDILMEDKNIDLQDTDNKDTVTVKEVLTLDNELMYVENGGEEKKKYIHM